MLKIIEKIMFNLYYSNHLLQLIGHNPMNISNPNSARILQKVVYIEFENVLRHFPRKKGS